ncbi:hypothetical protein K438DRAFT_1780298 [Mycena galopus ATCC 62051]|nr:hypothetical protein K438DRAFT_1780298 [Mycena galopus ATCC 62051]
MEMGVAIKETKDLGHSQELVEVLEILRQSVREINQLAKAISSREKQSVREIILASAFTCAIFAMPVAINLVHLVLLVKYLVNDFHTFSTLAQCLDGWRRAQAGGITGLSRGSVRRVGATAADGARVCSVWGAPQGTSRSPEIRLAQGAGGRNKRREPGQQAAGRGIKQRHGGAGGG